MRVPIRRQAGKASYVPGSARRVDADIYGCTVAREADKGGITLQLATTKDFNGVAIDCYVEREGD